MTMLRDYKMYTYNVSYEYDSFAQNSEGERYGPPINATATFKPVVVARSNAVADAWVQEKFDAPYLYHREFTMSIIDTQPAPHLILEVPY